MTTKQAQEQMQQDLLTLIESFGIAETMPPDVLQAFQTIVCEIVISNIKKITKI